MDESRQREQAIFEVALKLPPEQRLAHCAAECVGDSRLRERLEARLRAAQPTASPAENPAPTLAEMPSLSSNDLGENWADVLTAYNFLREAKALISETTVAASKP